MFAELLKVVQPGRWWRSYLWCAVCAMIVLMAAGCASPQAAKPTGSGLEAINQNAGSQNAAECFGLQTMAKSASDPEISMISEAQQHFEEGMERLQYVGVNPWSHALIAPPTPYVDPELKPGDNPAQEAYDSFSQAIVLDEKFAAAYMKRALVSYSLEKDPKDILADLDAAVHLRPDYAEAWMERFYILFEVGTTVDAVSSLDCVLAIEPNHFEALRQRGNYHKMNMEWEKALADLSNAIAHMPEKVDSLEALTIYFDRGYTYLNLEQWENAANDFTKAIEAEDTAVEAWLNRAIVYEKAGKVEAAVADYNHTLALDLSRIVNIQKRLPDLKKLLATLEEGSAAYTGLQDLITKVEQTDSEARRYFEEGMKKLEEEKTNVIWTPDYRPVIESFSNAIALNPGVAEYYYQRAQAYMLQGMDSEAVLVDMEKTIDLDSNHAEAHYYRALILFNRGDEENSLADLNHSIELKPRYFEPRVLRARMYMQKGDKDTALPDIMMAIENMPGDVDQEIVYELYTYRAPIYYAQGNWQGAASDYTKLIEINPLQPDNYFYRGATHLELGNVEDLLADLNKALEMNPESVTLLSEKLPKLQMLLTKLTSGTETHTQLQELIEKVGPGSNFAHCAKWKAEDYAVQGVMDAIAYMYHVPWSDDILPDYQWALDWIILGTECAPYSLPPQLLLEFSSILRSDLTKLEPGTKVYARLEEVVTALDEAVEKINNPLDASCADFELAVHAAQSYAEALYQLRDIPEWNLDTIYIMETGVDFLIRSAECKPENTTPDMFSSLIPEFRKGMDQLKPGTDEYVQLEDLIAKLDEADKRLKSESSEQQPQLIGQ